MDELLDSAPVGFVSFDDGGIITSANQTFVDMLGHTRDDLVGTSFERVLNVGGRIFYHTHFFPLVRLHGRADEIFLILRTAAGEDIGVLVNAVRRTRDGGIANDCAVMQVRERQKYEAELLQARRLAEAAEAEAREGQRRLEEANQQLESQAIEMEQQAVELEVTTEELQLLNDQLQDRALQLEQMRAEADQANEAKSNFLAMMSHELRTPLNAISGYAQLMEMGVQGPINEAQRESLVRIQQSQRHLLRLVNEILNLARIEAGHIDYEIVDVPARGLVGAILPLVEPQMSQNKVTLDASVPEDLSVRCDVDKAQQILLNLLSNAIKFTPAGGTITVQAQAVGDANVALLVQDTGIGIPADMLQLIFDPFVQVETSPSRRGDGTGLGLAISRDLARGMGGDLKADSEPGKGSLFTLTLPVARRYPGDLP